MKTEAKTEIIILRGPVASGKTLIGGLLMEYYQSIDKEALLFENFEDNGDQLQKLFESDYYDYILITLLPDDELNAPCLEKPWKRITII